MIGTSRRPPEDALRVDHPFFSRAYHRVSLSLERKGRADHRRALLAGLSGRVIEVGSGPGFTFPFYEEAARVVAFEPEPYLRRQAADLARSVPADVQVCASVGEQLAVADASFDAGIACLVLCSVHAPDTVLAELHRVIRPGGVLRFYEHVRADGPLLRALQRAARPFWLAALGGCDPTRESLAAIERAGFEVQDCRSFLFRPWGIPFPTAPRILGTARRR